MQFLKSLRRWVWLLVVALSLIACTASDRPKPESPPLQIVYESWPGFLPIVIAREKGFFAQHKVKVEAILVESVITKIPEFSAGKYDGITEALGNVLTTSAANPNIRIIFATDVSDGADAVLSSPSILTVNQLKGKAIGTSLGGFGELFVTKMLEMNGMTLDDITLKNAQAEQISKLITSGKIQAGSTYQPHLSQAVKAGLRVLFTSKQTPGLIPDVMVFQESTLQNRPDDVRAFIRAWFQAVDYWKANPQEGNAIIAKALKVKPDIVSLTGVKLLTLSDNRQEFIPANNTKSLHYTTQLYANFFVRSGSLNHPPDINKLLDPSFLPSVDKHK